MSIKTPGNVLKPIRKGEREGGEGEKERNETFIHNSPTINSPELDRVPTFSLILSP